MEKFTFAIRLKTGESRQAGYSYLIHVLALTDEYFLGQSLEVASAENALYVAEVLQAKFSGLIESVIVYEEGREI